jgi:hypothetical protein
MVKRCFLATYHPMIHYAAGRAAVAHAHLPPFIDGSCRREPDLESPYPAITATCRAGAFAPRLQVGDEVAYLTIKGCYLEDTVPGWRFVAVLRVIRRFPSHEEAAAWYVGEGIPVPSNCFVADNPPKPLNLTHRWPPAPIRERMRAGLDDAQVVRLWDATYRGRIVRWPVLVACTPVYRDLRFPPQVRHQDVVRIFGRIPGTQNPPTIKRDQLAQLLRHVKGRAAEDRHPLGNLPHEAPPPLSNGQHG